MDVEAEEVTHSVAVAEENSNRVERLGDIVDSVATEEVPEPPDDERIDPTWTETGHDEEEQDDYIDLDFMNLVKPSEDDGELMA